MADLWDEAIKESKVKFRNEMVPYLQKDKERLEKKIIEEFLKGVEKNGKKTVTLSPIVKESESNKINLYYNPFAEDKRVSIEQLKSYCSPRTYDKYMQVCVGLNFLNSPK